MLRPPLLSCALLLLLWTAPAWAQAPPVAQSCEAQVNDLYRGLQTDRQVYDLGAAGWTQHLTAMATQIRLITTQYKMQQQGTEQAQAQAAQQAEIARQLKEALTAAQTRVKELEAQLPQAQ